VLLSDEEGRIYRVSVNVSCAGWLFSAFGANTFSMCARQFAVAVSALFYVGV